MNRIVPFLVVVLGACSACTKPNPVVCCTSPADCGSLGISETSRDCNEGFACIDHQCSTPVDAAIDAPICVLECEGQTPFCSSNGECVACLISTDCAPGMPVCDVTSASCRGCKADDECSTDVCDKTSGTCVASGTVRYASPGGAGIACTQTAPCGIAQAFAAADGSHPRVKLLAGTYNASVTVTGKAVIVHGERATWNAATGARTLEINDGGSVRLIGITAGNLNTSSTGIVIGCELTTATASTPTLVIDEAIIDSAASNAVYADDCTVSISNSELRAHGGAAVLLVSGGTVLVDRSVIDGGEGTWNVGGTLRITNSILRNHTGTNGAFVAVSPTFVEFSTIVNALVKCGSGVPACVTTGNVNGVCINNSIIYNPGGPTDTVQGSACVLARSLVYPQATTPSGTSNQLGVSPQMKAPSTGDYRLLSTSPAIDTADPGATNPIDFDGVSRPQGVSYDIGAFEYKP